MSAYIPQYPEFTNIKKSEKNKLNTYHYDFERWYNLLVHKYFQEFHCIDFCYLEIKLSQILKH